VGKAAKTEPSSDPPLVGVAIDPQRHVTRGTRWEKENQYDPATYERSSTDQLGQDSAGPGLKFPEITALTMPIDRPIIASRIQS
jgi:hypothetical protein